jgi:transposase InsO family protein
MTRLPSRAAPSSRFVGAAVRSHAPSRCEEAVPQTGTFRRARSPSLRSGSARSGHLPRPGTAWCGRSVGAAPGSACIQPSRKSAFARRDPTEMWHIDTTVIRLLDGSRVYLHAEIDNFSRRVLAWRVAETRAGDQCGGARRSRSERNAVRNDARRVGGRRRRERECPRRRADHHGRVAPRVGVHRTEVLELDDRGVVALPKIG